MTISEEQARIAGTQNAPAAGESGRGVAGIRLAATDSPTGEGSTIGAPGLNGSVRNGKR